MQFLSVVEIAPIPLYLAVASPLSISTQDSRTEQWLRKTFLNTLLNQDDQSTSRWWEASRPDSPLGILVSVLLPDDPARAKTPCVTEVLLYASSYRTERGPPSSSIGSSLSENNALSIKAMALSSDLICQTTTPPASPVIEHAPTDGVFLPSRFPTEAVQVNEPPVRKRKSATDAFDEATERRKRSRRKGGEGVSTTAVTKIETQPATSGNRRQSSDTQGQLSRSPSVSSSRPPTAINVGSRPSALSRMESVSNAPAAQDTESKNKDLISRIVMAGMRLHGLSQSKKRKSRVGSSVPSPAVDGTFEELEAERKNDEEFKLIYHQAFKGTCLAFRSTIATKPLQSATDAVRDVADRLLSIFCGDPLAGDLGHGVNRTSSAGDAVFDFPCAQQVTIGTLT